uniref:Uncharacterized protein n=1 Tax=Panagrolaimus davidi TaxID=227884 RepID=A0A914QIK1_9BILA
MTSKFWLWMILSFILACATTAEQNTSVYNESDSTNLLEKVECACEKVKRCFHVGWEETLPFVNGLSINFVPAKRLKFLNKCTSEKIQTYCFKDKDDSIRGYIEPTDFREEFAELMFYENMAECFTREGWNVTSPIVKKIRFECAKELMKYNIQVIFKNFKPRNIIRQWNLAKAKKAYFKRYNEEFVETEISIESRAYSNMFNAFTIFWFVVVSFLL